MRNYVSSVKIGILADNREKKVGKGKTNYKMDNKGIEKLARLAAIGASLASPIQCKVPSLWDSIFGSSDDEYETIPSWGLLPEVETLNGEVIRVVDDNGTYKSYIDKVNPRIQIIGIKNI